MFSCLCRTNADGEAIPIDRTQIAMSGTDAHGRNSASIRLLGETATGLEKRNRSPKAKLVESTRESRTDGNPCYH